MFLYGKREVLPEPVLDLVGGLTVLMGWLGSFGLNGGPLNLLSQMALALVRVSRFNLATGNLE